MYVGRETVGYFPDTWQGYMWLENHRIFLDTWLGIHEAKIQWDIS